MTYVEPPVESPPVMGTTPGLPVKAEPAQEVVAVAAEPIPAAATAEPPVQVAPVVLEPATAPAPEVFVETSEKGVNLVYSIWKGKFVCKHGGCTHAPFPGKNGLVVHTATVHVPDELRQARIAQRVESRRINAERKAQGLEPIPGKNHKGSGQAQKIKSEAERKEAERARKKAYRQQKVAERQAAVPTNGHVGEEVDPNYIYNLSVRAIDMLFPDGISGNRVQQVAQLQLLIVRTVEEINVGV